MATITRNVTESELESNTKPNILTLVAEGKAKTVCDTKTSFLSLPRELRHSILRQTVKLNELEEATQQPTDRFLTWDELFDDHEQHIHVWGTTLTLVHRQIYDDVQYVIEKWEDDFQALHSERLVAYEEVARKRRALCLEAEPRKLRRSR